MGYNRLKDKVALVTGSTSGIGEAIARVFAREGAKVVVSGRRTDKGEKIRDEILAAGGDAIYVRADMTVDADMDHLIESAINNYGRIDILVNNAGTFLHKGILETTKEEWDHLLRLDARAYFIMMQQTIPHMLNQGSGSIINVTSNMGVMPASGFALYNFIKAGLTHLSKSVALEFAGKGIRVNCLMPGATMTEMTADQPDNAEIAAMVPLGRYSTAEEQAYAAVFLASDESAYMTGAPLILDGGWYPY
jgi:NAD(P)-dependent dehydrogenase (short-subunit alcohol dehydrogenase family)